MTRATQIQAPILPQGFEYRPELTPAATSRELKAAARHRWYYFPHSFSHRLVSRVLDHWEFPPNGTLADNFVGSGTTLLTAQERGLTAVGFDLSPLAVTIANTKVASYKTEDLNRALQTILCGSSSGLPQVPERLSKAFTEQELEEIFALLEPISELQDTTRYFFLVALLWTVRAFSRAVPDGGWFRWQTWSDRSREIKQSFESTVSCMLADVATVNWTDDIPFAQAYIADARKLPRPCDSVDGFITSPPYANRHDYSRVFHIDLLLLGVAESQITKLRHGSIRSHVEATPPNGYRRALEGYRTTEPLGEIIEQLPPNADARIRPMLEGYFEDIYLSLLEMRRVLRPGGRAAYVVGNVRHAGVMVPVDEILAALAVQAGLKFEAAWVLRFRGNSAQQMASYGREPARETVVLLSKVVEQ